MATKKVFERLVQVTPQLQAVVGKNQLTRPEITKSIWSHIKQNSLQNPEKKREIICDSHLRAVFGKDKLDMLEILKLVQPHIKKIE
ncbi:unnamed protein product [Heterosigma akashiwo]|mmetsp:Transcript_7856/g.10976  ORF Transcript_7856/g.10976 Transcript_7856/m.10976 type:complete len:86 (+) Transcript_7856:234-491(+)